MLTVTTLLLLLSRALAGNIPAPVPSSDAAVGAGAMPPPSPFIMSEPIAIPSFVSLLSYTVGVVGVTFRPAAPGLPDPKQITKAIVDRGIHRVRLVDPDATSISAFEDSQIDLHLALERISLVESFAVSQDNAETWLRDNLLPSLPSLHVSVITVGYGILVHFPNMSRLLPPAVKNMYTATRAIGMMDVMVTTAHAFEMVENPVPPSSATFNMSQKEALAELLAHDQATMAPFVVSLYPFYLYQRFQAARDDRIKLPFAMFMAREDQYVQDPVTNMIYTNLFELMVDACYVSLIKMGRTQILIVVSGTGWHSKAPPTSKGASDTSFLNAAEYNERLVTLLNAVLGTPLQRFWTPPTFIYSLFDDDEVGNGEWSGWGLWNKQLQPKYEVNFLQETFRNTTDSTTTTAVSPTANASGRRKVLWTSSYSSAGIALLGLCFLL